MNGWKVTAWIFIGLFILETLLFIWVAKIGVQMIDNETECAVNICQEGQYDSFSYDEYEKVCYCFLDGEIAYQKFIGD